MFDPNFDRQKLMFHPQEVAEWYASGATKGPLYTEMELTRRCNCRCIFCGVDHQVNTTADCMDLALAQKVIDGLADCGNKSVMLCGNGEPLLNPDVVEIAHCAARSMSVSMTSNGAALSKERLAVIDALEWIRFSVNGCTPENYRVVHGTTPETFNRVLENIALAVERKKQRNLPVTIGTQLVLLPENAESVVEFAGLLKGLGVDYFSVKPYSQHPLSRNRQEVDYRNTDRLAAALRSLEDENFRIIFRHEAMRRVGSRKSYPHCFGTHFIAFVSANGDLWECNVFVGDQRFFIGNLQKQSFRTLWSGARRQEILRFIGQGLCLDECRDLCRMEACNQYLARLKKPLPHDNFI